jgi:23S rRNA pseudouridine955/2504/2580 synthase
MMAKLSDEIASGRPRVRYVDISEDEAGQRIDNFLMSRLKGLPRSRVYRLLRRGEVRVNKGRVQPTYRIQAGDVVRIPPVQLEAPAAADRPAAATREYLVSRILFEDGRLMVLDKPAGMAVHGGSGLSFGVIEALRAARRDCPYLELVHRLDRETSGCLLVAKRRSYLRSLHEALRENRVEKRYLALVMGQWSRGPARLEHRLEVTRGAGGERIVRAGAEGKRAVSRVTVVEPGPVASLVEVALETGRTHQIRVQLAAEGHPLAGDDRYGDPDFNRRLRAAGLARMFLHAHAVAFDDPVTGEPRSFGAPLPQDLRAVLDRVIET